MKKNRTYGLMYKIGLLKMIKMMRFTIFILLLSLSQTFAVNSYSQQAKLSLDMRNARLEDVLDRIEKNSEFFFMYNKNMINVDRKVDIQVEEKNVSEVLNKIFANTDISYSIKDRQILLISSSMDVKGEPITQQQKFISGRVTDSSGGPLPGVSVVVKGTTTGVITDMDGKYSLPKVSENAILQFSFVGMKTQEVVVTGKPTINVTLVEESIGIDEVVAVGYGSLKKSDVTTSIVSADAQDLKDQSITSFEQGLVGRLSGVQISQSNGAPGGGINMTIRGTSSISGGNSPLIVVDGVPLSSSNSDKFSQGQSTSVNFSAGYTVNPLSAINPSDIESIEILKDAAAASIYGSRGSNGVILIQTKSGKYNKKSSIKLNVYGGIQQVTKKVDVMNAYELAQYSKLARDNSWIAKDPAHNSANDPLGQRATTSDRYAQYFIPYLNGEKGLTDTDWQDEIFRTAPIQNYEISMSGGKENLNYYVSGNYFDQEGIVINSGLKRYGARVNLNAKFSDKVRMGVNFNPSYSDYKIVQTEQNWGKEGVIITALMFHPNLSPRNPDGSLRLGEMIKTNYGPLGSSVALIENPVALAELIKNSLDHTRLLGNSFLELDIIDGLTFKTSIGIDLNFMDRAYYRPKVLNFSNELAPTATNNYAWTNNSSTRNWLSENTLSYKNIFGKHSLNYLVGYTAQKERNKRQYLEGRDFPNDIVTTLNAAKSTTGFTEEREWSLLSYLGRVQYNFDNKYLLNVSLRRDGSSRFGKNTKWGWFPSLSSAWRVSNEKFFPKDGIIDDLKVRASYGLTGNTEIPFYGGTALLNIEGYVLGNKVVTGFAPVTAPNPNLSWETTSNLDVGSDINLFRNKLTVSADYYISNTRDLLLDVTVPGTSGFQSSLQNVGELENKGFELTVGTTQKFRKITWTGSFNFSTNKNKVIALAPGQTQFLKNGGLNDPSFIVKVGAPLGSYYGYKVLGTFKTQEQFNSTPHLVGQNQGVGDFIYADTNNDGKVDTNDRTILGDNNPDFTWGCSNTFEFGNIDLSFNIQGVHGFEIFNAMHRYLAETWGNDLSVYLRDDAPRPVWGIGTSSHTRPSSWHVEDGSFIRVQNIKLGYTLPSRWFSNKALSSVKCYVSALNPFTFTKYSGYNPEVSNNSGDATRAGEDFGNYPVSKSFVFGFNIEF